MTPLATIGYEAATQAEVIGKLKAAAVEVVIDVRADPIVIALPPHATFEQTTKFFAALAKGDPDRDAVLKQLARQLAL